MFDPVNKKGQATTLNEACPLRQCVVGTSGNMCIADGHHIAESTNVKAVEDYTRWCQIQQAAEYHAQVASLWMAPTVFRLPDDAGTNFDPQLFSTNGNNDETKQAIQKIEPENIAPLTEHTFAPRPLDPVPPSGIDQWEVTSKEIRNIPP